MPFRLELFGKSIRDTVIARLEQILKLQSHPRKAARACPCWIDGKWRVVFSVVYVHSISKKTRISVSAEHVGCAPAVATVFCIRLGLAVFEPRAMLVFVSCFWYRIVLFAKKKTRWHHLRLKTWSAIPMLPAVKAFVSTDLGEYCWLLLGMATLPKRLFFHLTWFLCVRDVDSLLWPNQAVMNIQHPTIFFKRVGKKEARTLSFPDASTHCSTTGFCYSSRPQGLNVYQHCRSQQILPDSHILWYLYIQE